MKRGSVVVGYLDGGHWSAVFGQSYLELCLYDITHPAFKSGEGRIVREGGKQLRYLTGTGALVDNRNNMARDFLDNTDGEWLFSVDTDMGFSDDTVERLIKSADPVQRPVVGALAFALKRGKRGDFRAEKFEVIPTVYEYVELEDEVGFLPVLDYPREQLMQVSGTGAACMLIHRTALHRIREKYGDIWFDQAVHPTGYKGKPRKFSEDLSFCTRVQGAGMPVYVDTSIKTCHEKGGVFLDEEEYDLRRKE